MRKKKGRFGVYSPDAPGAQALGHFSTRAAAKRFARHIAEAMRSHLYVYDAQEHLATDGVDFRPQAAHAQVYNRDR